MTHATGGVEDEVFMIFVLLFVVGVSVLSYMLWEAWKNRNTPSAEEALKQTLDEIYAPKPLPDDLKGIDFEELNRQRELEERGETNTEPGGIFDIRVFEEGSSKPTSFDENESDDDVENNIDGKSFEQMTPDEFEDAVCKLFNAFGYNLSVTQRSKDGGIDLDGLRGGLGRARVVVQCKRYNSPVGVSAVRELFGVVSDDPDIAEGFLVTTSTFTQDAQAFARGKRITLIDGSELEMRFSKIAGSDPVG